jgi:hypothetical protein
MRVTRRGLQLTLAVLWLFDGVLQCQPFMFTHSFADTVLRTSGDGQPAFVASPVHLAASVVAAHPLPWNVAFAAVQLAIGAALIWRRTARAALAASILWSIGVWWLGEGLGGLFSGHAMLLTGAPGAVLLYAVVAVAAWPKRDVGSGEPPRMVATTGWVVVWVLGALLQALPGQNTPADLADALGPDSPAPGWLTGAGHALARTVSHGYAPLVVLGVLQALIGAGAAVRHRVLRRSALLAGVALAVAFWLFGQGLGELTTGTSTDPNSAPLLVVLAAAAWGAVRMRRGSESQPLMDQRTHRAALSRAEVGARSAAAA